MSEIKSRFSDHGDEARQRLHKAFPPAPGPGGVKVAIGRAARALKWSPSRTKDIWYGDARRVDPAELDPLRKLTPELDEAPTNPQRGEATRDELSDLRECISRLERLKAAAEESAPVAGASAGLMRRARRKDL